MLDEADTIARPRVSFDGALETLLANIESAFGYDRMAHLSTAYQDFTDAYIGVLSGSNSPDLLAATSNRFVDVVSSLVSRPNIADELEDAAADYVADLADACDQYEGAAPDLTALVSIASAATLLSWLHGALQIGGPLGYGTGGSMFGNGDRSLLDPLDVRSGSPRTDEEDTMTDLGSEATSDDDGIVWQEFSVGDDGDIVRTTSEPAHRSTDAAQAIDASSNGAPHERSRRDETRRRRSRPTAPHRPTTAANDDPVEVVRTALHDYMRDLGSAGITVDARDLARSATAPSARDLEQQSTDVTNSYLRVAHGVGSLTELYGNYARLLGSISELVEQHISHIRHIEQLSSVSSSGFDRERTAEELYRKFVAATRDAWVGVDPDTITRDELASINETIAEAATLHQALTRPRQDPRWP